MDRLAKSLMYVEAVLSFIQCGNAMEHNQVTEPNKIYTMYRDTLNLLRHICKIQGSQEADVHETERKLSVLSFRIQSLLCLKLFKLKKAEVAKLKRAVEDHNKAAASKTMVQAHSPYQTNWNRSNSTPSPMSPTPSPAGSVGSVGSVGSGSGIDHRLTNGCLSTSSAATTGTMSSPSTVAISQRIHSVTQNYLTHMSNLYQSHELWDQGDTRAKDHKAFFKDLDAVCGVLTLHSSIIDLVQYVKLGLYWLKGL